MYPNSAAVGLRSKCFFDYRKCTLLTSEVRGLRNQCTVKPLLSSHPWGTAEWRHFNTG